MYFLLALFFSLTSLVPFDTPMCSCAANPPPEVALKAADLVFTGVVKDISVSSEDDYSLFVEMHAFHKWKGDLNTEIIVETASSSSRCGFPFEKNQGYLVYASFVGESIRTSGCSRTTHLDYAKKDLLELGVADPIEGHRPRCGGPTAAVMLQTFMFLFIGIMLIKAGKARRH